MDHNKHKEVFFKIFNRIIKEGWRADKAASFFAFAMRTTGLRQDVSRRNIELIFPTKPKFRKKQILRRSYDNLVWNLLEYAAWQNDPGLLDSMAVDIKMREELDAALASGRKVIAVSARMGNWAFLSAWLKRNYGAGCSFHRHGEIEKYTPQGLAAYLEKELEGREILLVAGDRRAVREGAKVSFLGQETSTTTLPARCALAADASVVPVTCTRAAPYKAKISFGCAMEPPRENTPEAALELTQAICLELEKRIILEPEQWLWQQNRFEEIIKAYRQ
ncbi:MAG: hypothetical protein RRY12_08330 [Cloacibacillus sp.]